MVRWLRDLRHALRTFARQPAFAVLVAVTLGLGIGASTAIFSVVDAVLLRPLPYEDPDRLVFIWNRLGETGVEKSAVAAPDFVDYGEQSRAFEALAGFGVIHSAITDEGGSPESIHLAFASPSFFSLLGVELVLGEMYGPDDEGRIDPARLQDPGAGMPPAPAIISHGLWQRRYGGSPAVLGKEVRINGQSMVITGVAPEGFRLYLPPDAPISGRIDLWTPFPIALRTAGRSTQWINVLGRLKPGVGLGEAQGEMDRIAAWQRQHFEFHRNAGMEIRVIPMHEDVTGEVRPYLIRFLMAAGLLLLLTFANVTNLLLLRGWRRRQETSIRAALGSGRWRLLRQLLTETTLLSLMGAGAGVLLAHGGIRLLLALQPRNLPRVGEAGIDATVMVLGLGMALVAALVCALVSAFQASRMNLAATLSERSRSATPAQQWLGKGLVVGEMAISLVLLVSTGLIARSVAELARVDLGFQPQNVLTARVSVPLFKYLAPQRRAAFFHELVRRAGSIPGVEQAAGVTPLPLDEGRQAWWGPWSVEGMNHEQWTKNEAEYRATMPGYFEAMGMQLVRGRFFTTADNEQEARLVAIVDEVLARRAWPGEDALGKRLMVWRFAETGTGLEPVWSEVVGVVRHARENDLIRDGIGAIYCPFRLYSFYQLSLTLKSATSDPLSLVGPLREVVESIDPDQPVDRVRPMQDYVDEALAPTRFALTLMGVFAAIATVLAAVGLYGVISSAVQQRTHEIGVRMAFGAVPGSVIRLVLRQSLGLALGGLLFGLIAAVVFTRGLSEFLPGVRATDPLTFAGIAVLQLVIALVASLVPTWRAIRVDPTAVLNTE